MFALAEKQLSGHVSHTLIYSQKSMPKMCSLFFSGDVAKIKKGFLTFVFCFSLCIKLEKVSYDSDYSVILILNVKNILHNNWDSVCNIDFEV